MPLMYAAGWAASIGALATLALIIHLICRGGVRPTRSTVAADYGLLREVLVIGDLAIARELRLHLVSNGVRATLATDRHGMVRVLVFGDELDRARRLITS